MFLIICRILEPKSQRSLWGFPLRQFKAVLGPWLALEFHISYFNTVATLLMWMLYHNLNATTQPGHLQSLSRSVLFMEFSSQPILAASYLPVSPPPLSPIFFPGFSFSYFCACDEYLVAGFFTIGCVLLSQSEIPKSKLLYKQWQMGKYPAYKRC